MAHHPDPLGCYGLALAAFHAGDTAAELLVQREDGVQHALPVSHFFREESAFSPLEMAALENCRGTVLDLAAGTGLHSLVLQRRGFRVTAVDLSPEAVAIMAARGVADARLCDVTTFRGGRFDTLLMLGHGIGVVEDLRGLDRFLARARSLVRAGGQVLAHSLDVGCSDDPHNREYQERNRRAGRYPGETRIRFAFRGVLGPYRGWLHVDPETLAACAARAGWICETVLAQEDGDHLARLLHGG